MGTKGTRFSLAIPNQEINYLMSLLQQFSPKPLIKVHNLFLSILNSIFIWIFLKSY